MGNCLCIDNIDDEIIKPLSSKLTPKLNTYIQFCKSCNKYFYINNTNKCYECIFNYNEFCEYDYIFSYLSKLNIVMNEMIKNTKNTKK